MNATLLNPRSGIPQWEPKYPFDLVVAYEDTATRSRAMKLYDHVAQQLLDEYDFQCSWWKFDHLRDPVLHQEAADGAAEANMIILSFQQGKEMLATAKTWIGTWLTRKTVSKSALVTLVGEAQEREHHFCPVHLFLQNVARLAKMDFFFHASDSQPDQPVYSPEIMTQRAQTVTPVLEEILSYKPSVPFPRWGINE